jgi:hypothetical protein
MAPAEVAVPAPVFYANSESPVFIGLNVMLAVNTMIYFKVYLNSNPVFSE